MQRRERVVAEDRPLGAERESGGENVFPAEVEDLLAKHNDVSEAAIIGVEDEKFGQALKAFVVPCSGKKPSEDTLKKYVKENLANYKVPKAWVFLDELPRNATGKVLKKDLAEVDGDGGEDGKQSENGKSSKSRSQSESNAKSKSNSQSKSKSNPQSKSKSGAKEKEKA